VGRDYEEDAPSMSIFFISKLSTILSSLQVLHLDRELVPTAAVRTRTCLNRLPQGNAAQTAVMSLDPAMTIHTARMTKAAKRPLEIEESARLAMCRTTDTTGPVDTRTTMNRETGGGIIVETTSVTTNAMMAFSTSLLAADDVTTTAIDMGAIDKGEEGERVESMIGKRRPWACSRPMPSRPSNRKVPSIFPSSYLV
jgi:hypothetical protein